MRHYDLCRITAERFLKESDIVLFEFKVMGISENPDVLCSKDDKSKLFEIKCSRSDFLADAKKESRIEYKAKYWPMLERYSGEVRKITFGKPEMKEFIREAPHLGISRYYVCETGLIRPDEVGAWGLYYYNGRFKKVKESKTFKRDLFLENQILVNALRFVNDPNPQYNKSRNILTR